MSSERHVQGVFMISVAAELAGMHPQTLRVYERKGLVAPARTGGMSRRYSEADLERIRRVQELTDEGLNLAGVKKVLALEREVAAAKAAIEQLEQQRATLQDRRAAVQSELDAVRKAAQADYEQLDHAIPRQVDVDLDGVRFHCP